MIRGRTPRVPWSLFGRTCSSAQGRRAARVYLAKLVRATVMQRKALNDGQLLKDLAWARCHLRVIDVWLNHAAGPSELAGDWLQSYERVLMRFPAPLQC